MPTSRSRGTRAGQCRRDVSAMVGQGIDGCIHWPAPPVVIAPQKLAPNSLMMHPSPGRSAVHRGSGQGRIVGSRRPPRRVMRSGPPGPQESRPAHSLSRDRHTPLMSPTPTATAFARPRFHSDPAMGSARIMDAWRLALFRGGWAWVSHDARSYGHNCSWRTGARGHVWCAGDGACLSSLVGIRVPSATCPGATTPPQK